MGEKEIFGFADEVEFVHKDKDGKIINKWTSKGKPHKCLTDLGFKEVAHLILSDQTGDATAFDYIAIGTGAVAADHEDTTLGTEQSRLAAVGTTVTTTEPDDTAQWVITFSQAADAGLTGTDDITEVGVFNAAADGIMLMRQVFAAESMNWDAGDTLEFTVRVQVKQGA